MPGSKQKSNQSLLIEWFEAYKTGVYRYIRLIVSSKEDAEDILQKTFLALHQKGDTIQSIKYPKTYIYKVARNYALKRITRKTVKIVSLDNLLIEPAENPFHQWITAEMLNWALEQIPQVEREAVILKTKDRMTFREIGQITDSFITTAASRYFRGIKKLKQILESSHENK
jgi:RNA polymerase sigma factor (sigma-70 family)